MATPLPPPTVGSGALYAPSAALTASSTPPPQPKFAPVAHFASLPNDGVGNDSILKQLAAAAKAKGEADEGGIPTSGRLLAINGSYIAYAVKKGLVRVIDRRSAAKTLLRGHDEATRIVDAAFFGDLSGREGVGGAWDQLAALKRQQSGGKAGGESNKLPLPPAAASDVLATLAGASGKEDAAAIVVWRIRSNDGLEGDKLLEVRYPGASRIVWHPFNPNRFLLLRRNLPDDDTAAGASGKRTVATFVETTRLVTRQHESEKHQVCECLAKEPGSGAVPGMVPLKVLNEDGADPSLAGANDVSWSKRDARHVLTGHDDGYVRLWDLTPAVHPAGEAAAGVPCVATADVATAAASESKRVTRALFLSQYEDGTTANAATPPFVVGTDMNHTIALWSSFPLVGASIGAPACLRVFGLRDGPEPSFPLSSMLNVELIPAPYRPPLSSEVDKVTVPSSFVMLAERTSGAVHALHLDTAWTEGEGDAVTVRGFDYVATLNVVHPVYSYCVGPTSAEGDGHGNGGGGLDEERDVDLCCLQSKAVQMLALSAEACAPPEDVAAGAGLERTALAPGVTLWDRPTDGSDDEGLEAGEEEFEEDYDLEEDGTGAEYSTGNDSGDDDDEEEDEAAVPTTAAEESRPGGFSNWLGNLMGGGAAKDEEKPAAPTPPPPGLDFPSILPPPPGMSPPPPEVAPSLAPGGVALLSPLQILREGGSASTSPNTLPAKAEPAPPAQPAAQPASKPAKRPAKKPKEAKKAPAPGPPAGPTKILRRADPAVAPSGNAASPTAAAVDNGSFDGSEAALLASVRQIVASEVASQVGGAVRAAVRESLREANQPSGTPNDPSVERAVASALSGLPAIVEAGVRRGIAASLDAQGALAKPLDKHATQAAERAARAAVGAMRPQIASSLNQTVREVAIPACEAAAREMFRQTEAALERGLRQMAARPSDEAEAAPTLRALAAQVAEMTKAVQALSAEVVQLRVAVNGGGAGTPKAAPPPGPLKPAGVRPEIAALCRARRYEEAFTQAVSASDGAVVLFACQNADATAVFDGEASISQPILICLMQQLGAVLVTSADPEDVKTILTWLQEIAVTIDPSNPNIQRHVGTVVQQVMANINSKMSNCDPAFRRPLQTLMQVIRGLL
ncbi:hypothetical protein ACHAXT_009161 [Thalassiosira profunda]